MLGGSGRGACLRMSVAELRYSRSSSAGRSPPRTATGAWVLSVVVVILPAQAGVPPAPRPAPARCLQANRNGSELRL